MYSLDVDLRGLTPEPVLSTGWKQVMTALLSAFPAACFVVEDTVVKGNTVAVDHTLRGRHEGMPPIGKQAALCGSVIYRGADRKLAEGCLNVVIQQIRDKSTYAWGRP